MNVYNLVVTVCLVYTVVKASDPPGVCDPKTCYGRPGKRGPRGEKGDVGPPGPPGKRDIGEEIDERINPAIAELQDHIKRLEARLIEKCVQSEPTVPPPKTYPPDLCHVNYLNKCFWMVYHGAGVNYDQAQEICRKVKGGTLANIYDETHYNNIMEAVRGRIPNFLNFHTLWTGMKYKAETKATTFSDGSVSNFQRWYPGAPFAIAASVDMILWIAKNPSENNQGMWNYGRNTIHHGALCEL